MDCCRPRLSLLAISVKLRATLAAHCLSGRKRIPLPRYGSTIGNRKSDLDAAIAGPLLRSWGGKELLIGSRGIVDSAAQPHIIAFNCPVAELKYVFGNGWCALETKIVNQYLAQFSPVAPADTAFESCIDKPMRVEASDIVSPEDARFRDLTNYWDDLHFH